MMTSNRVEKKILVCLFGTTVLSACAVAAGASSPPSRNAAFVYYQACLLASHVALPDNFGSVMTSLETRFDPDPGAQLIIRSPYFQEVIELTTAASKMSQCDWGLVRTWRLSAGHQVGGGVRQLGGFLVAHARVLALDGQYKAALEVALTMRRVSRHLGDDALGMWFPSGSLNVGAFALIQYVLGKMPPNANTLTWLEKELPAGGDLEWHSRETLTHWRDREIECLQLSPELLAKQVEANVSQKEREDLTPTQVLERARLAYDVFLESVLEILESERSCQGKYHDLEQLLTKAEFNAADGDPTVLLSDLISSTRILYRTDIYHRAHIRAVKAAIVIYHIKATTGQLPQTLPTGLPKDLYSGKDFEYRVTDEGFILRCRAETPRPGPNGPEVRQFEFPVVE